MRYMTYTNANGGSVILGQTDYPITSLEGLGVPGVDISSQKAPYQDGTTWIDNTLSEREIVVEGAINKPKDMPEMYAAKSALMAVLNPKLGQGTLVYTDDNGSRQVTCTPQITFSSKEGTDPFLRYSVTFTCNDPYFYATTETTIADLPIIEETETDTVNIGATIGNPNDKSWMFTNLENGNVLSYVESASNSYLVEYEPGVGYGTVITNGFLPDDPIGISEDGDGNIYLFYINSATPKVLRYKKYNGATWGSEQTLHTSTNFLGSIRACKSNDGGIFVHIFYNDTIGGAKNILYKYSIFTETWDSGTVLSLNTNSSSSKQGLIQQDDGRLYMSQIGSGAFYELHTIVAGVVTETVQFGDGSAAPTTLHLYKRNNNTIEAYTYSGGGIQNFIKDGIVIGENIPVEIVAFLGVGDVGYYHAINSTTNLVGKIYDVDFTSSGITINGHGNAELEITITGVSYYPVIFNAVTREYIAIRTDLMNVSAIINEGDSVIVNTGFGRKAAKYINQGVILNGMKYLQVGSTFLTLPPGLNKIYVQNGTGTNGTVSVKYRERYLGA